VVSNLEKGEMIRGLRADGERGFSNKHDGDDDGHGDEEEEEEEGEILSGLAWVRCTSGASAVPFSGQG
jgi:hypothetical protein